MFLIVRVVILFLNVDFCDENCDKFIKLFLFIAWVTFFKRFSIFFFFFIWIFSLSLRRICFLNIRFAFLRFDRRVNWIIKVKKEDKAWELTRNWLKKRVKVLRVLLSVFEDLLWFFDDADLINFIKVVLASVYTIQKHIFENFDRILFVLSATRRRRFFLSKMLLLRKNVIFWRIRRWIWVINV